MKPRPLIQSSEKGQSFTELAILLPIFLVMIVGIIDLGKAMWTYSILRNAAQEGSSYASIKPTDLSGIESRVRDSSAMPINLKDTSAVSVTITSTKNCAGGQITVGISTTYAISTPFLGSILGSQGIPMSTNVTSTILTPPCP